jgi:biopolymer transport protein ExbD
MIQFRKKYSYRALIDITSLIDLVFLLVAFFMVTSSLSSQSAIEVNLPKADTHAADKNSGLVITVSKENKIYINDLPVSTNRLDDKLNELSPKYKGKKVIIRGDKKANYDIIVRVMDSLSKNGLSRFTLSTSR